MHTAIAGAPCGRRLGQRTELPRRTVECRGGENMGRTICSQP
ncbi:hypothetical protein [Kamptonema formosum]|nr:hypothetical protein [Oscillatoria sp. PCC 10802]